MTNYSKKQIPTINGPYVLNVKTASGEKTKIIGVHSLYAIDTMKDWKLGNSNLEEQIENLYDSSMKSCSETEGYTDL